MLKFGSKKIWASRREEELEEVDVDEVEGGVRKTHQRYSEEQPGAPASSSRGRKVVEAASTNVVLLDLPSLVGNAEISTGEALLCTCGAAFSSISKIDRSANVPTWKCEFCGVEQPYTLNDEEKPQTDTVDYLICGPQVELSSGEAFSVIFVCDISGSMCVTEATEGPRLKGQGSVGADVLAFREGGAAQYLPNEKRGVTYVSRLQCVQAAIEHEILTLKKKCPMARVGVVCFSTEVLVVGDGSHPAVVVTGDRLNQQDKLLEVGAEMAELKPVSETAERLVQAVYALEERGQTALGPGLCVALGMLKGAPPGSKIILCTDGLSNLGVGSIEDAKSPDALAAVEAYYRSLASVAKASGVPISVLAISGSQCKMEVLGAIAEVSGGQLNVCEATKIASDFASSAQEQVIATGVVCTVFVTNQMSIVDPLDPARTVCKMTRDIGTVVASTSTSFEFRFVGKDIKDPRLPFQVQTRYSRLDGSQLVRIQTLEQEVTLNREEAEAALDVDVVSANAMQQAAGFASRGDYSKAREKLVVNQKMMGRVCSPLRGKSSSPASAASPVAAVSVCSPSFDMPQQEARYSNFVQQAQQLDDLLLGQEKEEAASPVRASSNEVQMERRRVERSDGLATAIYKSKKYNAKYSSPQ